MTIPCIISKLPIQDQVLDSAVHKGKVYWRKRTGAALALSKWSWNYIIRYFHFIKVARPCESTMRSVMSSSHSCWALILINSMVTAATTLAGDIVNLIYKYYIITADNLLDKTQLSPAFFENLSWCLILQNIWWDKLHRGWFNSWLTGGVLCVNLMVSLRGFCFGPMFALYTNSGFCSLMSVMLAFIASATVH